MATVIYHVKCLYIHTHTHTHTHTYTYLHGIYVLCLGAQSCPTVCNPIDCSPPGSSVHGDSLGKNTGVGCHALLQGIFWIQGFNSGPPHWRQILYHLTHQGSPKIVEWVAYPFSRGASWPRNWTRVSCITGRFATSWATRETHMRVGSVCVCVCFWMYVCNGFFLPICAFLLFINNFTPRQYWISCPC